MRRVRTEKAFISFIFLTIKFFYLMEMNQLSLDSFGKASGVNVLDVEQSLKVQGGRAVDLIVVWINDDDKEEEDGTKPDGV